LATGGVNEKVVGSKKIGTKNGVSHLSEDEGEGEVEGGKGEGQFADSPGRDGCAVGGGEVRAKRR